MNNLDPRERAASGLVALEGLAHSPDGLGHMTLEDVQGGDLEDVANAMSALSDAGLLPPFGAANSDVRRHCQHSPGHEGNGSKRSGAW